MDRPRSLPRSLPADLGLLAALTGLALLLLLGSSHLRPYDAPALNPQPALLPVYLLLSLARLAVAYVVTDQQGEAVKVLDGYLARHPEDQDAVFVAVVVEYEAVTKAGVILAEADKAKLKRYARAYKGSQKALVEKYVAAMN